MEITKRVRDLDVAKGLMLIILAFNHLVAAFPSIAWVRAYTFSPIGFFSAAEGLFCISGVSLGLASRECENSKELFKKVFRRGLRLYGSLIFLAALLVSLCYYFPERFYEFQIRQNAALHPIKSLFSFAVLAENEPYLAILEVHCALTLLALPLLFFLKQGSAILTVLVSFSLWLMSQFVSPTYGVFVGLNPLAWQLLFVVGLILGRFGLPDFQRSPRFYRISTLLLSVIVVIWFWFLRYNPDLSTGASNDLYVTRKNLPLYSLLNFLAFSVLTMSVWQQRFSDWPPLKLVGNWIGRYTLPFYVWNTICGFGMTFITPLISKTSSLVQTSILIISIISGMLPIFLIKKLHIKTQLPKILTTLKDGWLCIALMILPLLYVQGFGTPYREAKTVLLWLVSGVCCFLLSIRVSTRPIFFGLFHLLLGLLLVWSTFVSLGASNPGLTIQFILSIVSALCISAYASNITLDKNQLICFAVFTLSITTIGVLLYTVCDVRLIQDANPFGHLIGERNSAAIILAQLIPLALALVGRSRRYLTVVPIGVVITLSATAILFCRTRSAWWMLVIYTLGLAVATLCFRKNKEIFRMSSCFALCLCLAIGLVTLLPTQLHWNSSTPYLDSFKSMASISSSSGRDSLWKVAGTMFISHPLIGVGAGNAPALLRIYIPRSGAPKKDFAFLRKDLPLFNDYLQAFAELGILGGALFLAIYFFWPAYLFVKILFSPKPSSPFLLMTIFSCFGTSINAFFDYPLNRPETLGLFSVLIGIATREVINQHSESASNASWILKPYSVNKLSFYIFTSIICPSIVMASLLFSSSLILRGYERYPNRAKSLQIAWYMWPWDRGWNSKLTVDGYKLLGMQFGNDMSAELKSYWPMDPEHQLRMEPLR